MGLLYVHTAHGKPEKRQVWQFFPHRISPLFELRFDRGHDLVPDVEGIDEGIEPGRAGFPILGSLNKRASEVELVTSRERIRNLVRAPLPQRVRDGRRENR